MNQEKPYQAIVIFIVGLCLIWLTITKTHLLDTNPSAVDYEVYASIQDKYSETIEEISDSKVSGKLTYLSKEDQIMHQANTNYWIKIVLAKNINNKRYLLVPGTTYNFIEVYVKNESSYKKLTSNKINKFLGINITTERPYFLLPQNFDREIFVHLNNAFATGIGFEIIPIDNYFNSLVSLYTLYAFYLGGMVFLIVYILIFFFKSGENTYLAYFLYLVSMTIFSLFHWKFFDSIMSSLYYLNFWYNTSYSFIIITILAYSLAFYQEQLKNSKYQRLIRIALWAKITLWLLAISTNIFWLNDRWVDIILLLPTITFSLKHFNQKTSTTWYFVLGMIIIYIGMLFMLIPRIFINFSDNNLFFIVALAQTYLFFFSIADKYALLKIEKEKALNEMLSTQLSLNTQLETGIQKAKAELSTAYLEIERINALLKNDNQKLQKNLKENTIQRFEKKLLSYEEFSNLFPDEVTCQKYIATMKWPKRPNCSKCGQTTFYKLNLSYGRRCKSCQYLESATANTVFDNIRFPIYKAFYILYRSSSEGVSKQLNLPVILDLRAGTCSSFRKKVLEQMKIKDFNPQKDAWEKLIVE